MPTNEDLVENYVCGVCGQPLEEVLDEFLGGPVVRCEWCRSQVYRKPKWKQHDQERQRAGT